MSGELWDRWQDYQDVALIFISSEELLEIDQCMAKAIKYVEAEDVSNSSAELTPLLNSLIFW